MPPKDDLWGVLKESITSISENSILCISSKVVSISEGRCIEIGSISKDELIKKESERYVERSYSPYGKMHTITQGIFITNAGIDESNGNGYYILWPKDPKESARKIWKYLKKEFKVKNIGVVVTDSRAAIGKRGSVGMALSYCGFKPLKDYRGENDLFGRKFKASQLNLPDNLAAASALVMGEGDEQTPLVICEDVFGIEFIPGEYNSNKPYSSYEVPMEEDLFSPFLNSAIWKKGNKI